MSNDAGLSRWEPAVSAKAAPTPVFTFSADAEGGATVSASVQQRRPHLAAQPAREEQQR